MLMHAEGEKASETMMLFEIKDYYFYRGVFAFGLEGFLDRLDLRREPSRSKRSPDASKDVLFRYTSTGEGAAGPWAFLAGRTGYIHADAASVFDRLFTGQAASAVELGCWAHARRSWSPCRTLTVAWRTP